VCLIGVINLSIFGRIFLLFLGLDFDLLIFLRFNLLVFNDFVDDIFFIQLLTVLENIHGLLQGLSILDLVGLILNLVLNHSLNSRSIFLATLALDLAEGLQLDQVLVDLILGFLLVFVV
jgi:hypothetical protein